MGVWEPVEGMTAYQVSLSARCPAVRERQDGRSMTKLHAANRLLVANQGRRKAGSCSDPKHPSDWLTAIRERLVQQTSNDERAKANHEGDLNSAENQIQATATCFGNEVLSAEKTTLKMHPTLLLALLRQQYEAVGRVWLLCRYIDTVGCGWLPLETVVHQLTKSSSPLNICGKRRLRQLLAAGEGRFWRREKSNDGIRVWLMSVARVAKTLDI